MSNDKLVTVTGRRQRESLAFRTPPGVACARQQFPAGGPPLRVLGPLLSPYPSPILDWHSVSPEFRPSGLPCWPVRRRATGGR